MPPTDFTRWVRETFDEVFPFDPGPLEPIAAGVWASIAIPVEELPVTPSFRPGDHVLTGVWGRGGQSDALYLVERCGPHRAFLRVPWGGPYGDPLRDRRRVSDTLTAYAAFRDRRAVLSESEVTSNMGDERASLHWPDGRALEIVGPSPIAPAPPFWPSLLVATR